MIARVLLTQVRSSRVPQGARVRVLGLCVQKKAAPGCLQLLIDDGTGRLPVRWNHTPEDEADGVQVGHLVECVGRINGSGPKLWLDAAYMVIVSDPNMESLRVLEILQFAKTFDDYLSLPRLGGGAMDGSVLPLMSFPNDSQEAWKRKVNVGSKRKSTDATSARQSKPPLSVEYHLEVSEEDLEAILDGTKSIEIRLNLPPVSLVRPGDHVTFNNSTTVSILATRKYVTLDAVLESEELNNCFPGKLNIVGQNTLSTKALAKRLLREYLSEFEELQHGLVLLQFKSTQNEPSKDNLADQIFRAILERNDQGATLSELVDKFPQVAQDTTIELLSNLQLDGLVYTVGDKYLPL